MKYKLGCIIALLHHVRDQPKESPINPEKWAKRKIDISAKDSLEHGKTTYSAISQIIIASPSTRTHNLTAMVSLRSTSDRYDIPSKPNISIRTANRYGPILTAPYFWSHGEWRP